MKQLLYLLFFMNLYSFSQSIDLGNTGDIKKTFFTQDNKEMYVFFKDSISIIDIQNFTSTSKTFVNYPANDFLKNYKVISVNSEIYFIEHYGGLVYNEKTKLASIIEIFKSVLSFLNDNKIEKLQLKLLPSIYHQKPAEEINYALFLVKAKLIRRDCLSVIDFTKDFAFSKDRKKCIRRGEKNGLLIEEELEH